jgi:hypothetical protein
MLILDRLMKYDLNSARAVLPVQWQSLAMAEPSKSINDSRGDLVSSRSRLGY